MDFFLCVMGMVMILEGLPYFAMPERVKEYLLRMQALPDKHLRFFGLALMLAGLSLVYWGRR